MNDLAKPSAVPWGLGGCLHGVHLGNKYFVKMHDVPEGELPSKIN